LILYSLGCVSGEYLDLKYHLDMIRREWLETIKEEHQIAD